MIVKVLNHYTEQEQEFSGTPSDIKTHLLQSLPWLKRYDSTGEAILGDLLKKLNAQQAYSVQVIA